MLRKICIEIERSPKVPTLMRIDVVSKSTASRLMLTLVPTAIRAVILPLSLSTVLSTPTSSRSSSVALVALTTSGTEPSRVDRRTPSALL